MHRVASSCLDPTQEERARALPQRQELRTDAPIGLLRVLRTGEPELVPAVTDSLLRAAAAEPLHPALLTLLQARSYMIVPLRARGHTLGAVTFVASHSGRRYGPEDLALAEDLCQRASLAIDNARLFGESRRATRAREDLLAVVSHDLRNPLSVVQLGAALLLRERPGVPRDEHVVKHSTRMRDAADRALRLISDLLDWGRLEAGGRLPLELGVEESTRAGDGRGGERPRPGGGEPAAAHRGDAGRSASGAVRPDAGAPGARQPAGQRGEVHRGRGARHRGRVGA